MRPVFHPLRCPCEHEKLELRRRKARFGGAVCLTLQLFRWQLLWATKRLRNDARRILIHREQVTGLYGASPQPEPGRPSTI